MGTKQEAETGNEKPSAATFEPVGVSLSCWGSADLFGGEASLLLGWEKPEEARGRRWQLWDRCEWPQQ